MDQLPGTQHRVGCAQGLGAALRPGVEGRQRVRILIGVAHLHRPAVRRPQPGRHVSAQPLHQRQHIRLDDEHDLIESGPYRVVHAVLHQYLTVGPYAVHLLVPTVARTHPCGHDDQCCVHSAVLLFLMHYIIPQVRKNTSVFPLRKANLNLDGKSPHERVFS